MSRQRRAWERHHLDSAIYSRRDLGHGVYGKEYELRAEQLEAGSRELLRAIWHNHQRIMLVAKACGRQVAQP